MYGGAWQWLKCFGSDCSDVGEPEFHLLGEARPTARVVSDVEGALGNGGCPRITLLCHFPQTWAGFPALQWNVAPQVLGEAVGTRWVSLQGQRCRVTDGPQPLAASRPARLRYRLLSARAPSRQPGCAGGLMPGCTPGLERVTAQQCTIH